jgi:hypothetical protein
MSAISSNRWPQYWPLGRVPECFDVSIQLPELDVATINELLGKLDSFGNIGASQIDTILDVAVWTHDESAVILHCGPPILEVEDPSRRHERSHRPWATRALPRQFRGPPALYFCCSCETFRVWLKWQNLS